MTRSHFDAWDKWRGKLSPLASVSPDPPKWILPGLLLPGMVLLAGEAKTLKTTLAMCFAAALGDAHPVPNYKYGKKMVVAKSRRTVFYVAYEQSAGRLRVMYEKRILRRSLKSNETHVVMAKTPHYWQVDEPQKGCDLVQLIHELQPILTVIDPLVNSHSQDENDPRMIRPFIPVREAALETGSCVLAVHHLNKGSGESSGGRTANAQQSFSRVRGTSALWGMMDAGHLVHKSPSGGLYYTSEFKDFPARQWTWKKP